VYNYKIEEGKFKVSIHNSFTPNTEPYFGANGETADAHSKLNPATKTNGSRNSLEPAQAYEQPLTAPPVVEPKRRGRKRGSTNATHLATAENRRRKRDSEVIVGERIRRLRLEAGLSQEELGRSSKMSTSYISRLETGEVNPTVDALTRIVRVFGLSIDGLLELNTDAPTILASDDLDPEIRVWLFKLKSKKVSARTKRIIQIVIEEELKELEGIHS
jgi:transcriptional regulator with XRE-family HTH domain